MVDSKSKSADMFKVGDSAADWIGYGLLFSAALLWSLNGAFIKAIHDQGRGPDGLTIAFYRSAFAGIILLPFAWRRMRSLSVSFDLDGLPNTLPGSPTPTHARTDFRAAPRPAVMICAVFFALMTACFVIANTMTESANAIILQYTSTLWLFALSPWLLRESPRLDDAWVLVLAMAGIGVIFFGNAGSTLPGLFVALAAGLFYALLTLMIRRLRGVDSLALTVANNIGTALLLAVPTLFWGNPLVSVRSLLLLALMGIVQFAVPYDLYARGLARVPAYQAGLITLAEPILVPIWTYLVVGETVNRWTAIGGVLLLISLFAFLLCAWKRATSSASTIP